MSCGNLATKLDVEMLLKLGVKVASSAVSDEDLPRKTGMEVARELGGRPLVRYLRRQDAGRYLYGDSNRHCTTPTAYASEDLIGFLNLPDPTTRRTHFLLLDAAKVGEILGPRYIAWGGGIEYVLPEGFPKEALINPWGMEIR
jgi:hypothetical protein